MHEVLAQVVLQLLLHQRQRSTAYALQLVCDLVSLAIVEQVPLDEDAAGLDETSAEVRAEQ